MRYVFIDVTVLSMRISSTRGPSHAFFPSVTAVASALAERRATSKGIDSGQLTGMNQPLQAIIMQACVVGWSPLTRIVCWKSELSCRLLFAGALCYAGDIVILAPCASAL